ncbi:MAG: hypothetical protein ACLQF1_21105 [Methyloceanibacter sp.]
MLDVGRRDRRTVPCAPFNGKNPLFLCIIVIDGHAVVAVLCVAAFEVSVLVAGAPK